MSNCLSFFELQSSGAQSYIAGIKNDVYLFK